MQDMQQRIVARFLAAANKTAAQDIGNVLKLGMKGAGLKQVQKAWDKLLRSVTEAKRQHDTVGGALPSADLRNIANTFIVKPLRNLSEEAEAQADAISKQKTAAADRAAVVVGAQKKDALWNELNGLAGRIQFGKFGYPTDKNAKYALKETVDLLTKAMKLIAPYDL